ncbi:MAG: membrane protein insertion efficiency factor YidD [Treponemataceae bacterium]
MSFTSLAMLFLRFYKKYISPLLPAACRFYPTCSEYAYGVIEKYGIAKGFLLSIKRLLRCHPFSKGGYDPVP